MNQRSRALANLIASMLIFGSIGLFVRYIPLESSIIALIRAIIGSISLSALLFWKREKLSLASVKRNAFVLFLSGAAIGFNWILLFESYRYTSVAVSTVCYYMAPMIVMSLSPFVLRERITVKSFVCILVAVCGVAFISGILRLGKLEIREVKGILFGLGAAVLYAAAILLNKRLHEIPATDRTVCQLFIAAVVLLPYNLLTSNLSFEYVTPISWLLLVAVGIVHTGLAYYLYFGSIEHLDGQSIAIASYIDPVVAVMVSAVILKEPVTAETVIGTSAILGAAFISEIPLGKVRKK